MSSPVRAEWPCPPVCGCAHPFVVEKPRKIERSGPFSTGFRPQPAVAKRGRAPDAGSQAPRQCATLRRFPPVCGREPEENRAIGPIFHRFSTATSGGGARTAVSGAVRALNRRLRAAGALAGSQAPRRSRSSTEGPASVSSIGIPQSCW
ncbi:Uncharacterised protein [Mycobacteroides abscessus subsp. abscessus]|nr:Uncharacterised protein [Mycobacteroides abscessus subsp. abscessus]